VRPNPTWLRSATSAVLLFTAFAAQAAAQQADHPLLSQEIRTVLERDGVEAAQARFEQIYPAQKDQYEIDMKGMAELGSGYMQAGDYEKGQAVMAMVAAISRDMMTSSGMMPANAAEAMQAEREREEEKEAEPEPRVAKAPDFGPARDDLARFAGVYGDPEQPESTRKLFVTQSCDGQLVAGAMWGDAQNWWMTSVSDNAFEMTSDFFSVHVEFQLGPDGQAQAMEHDLDFMPNPLPKVGPLPEGWGECLERGGS
jgi:hypothetical protein